MAVHHDNELRVEQRDAAMRDGLVQLFHRPSFVPVGWLLLGYFNGRPGLRRLHVDGPLLERIRRHVHDDGGPPFRAGHVRVEQRDAAMRDGLVQLQHRRGFVPELVLRLGLLLGVVQ